MNNPSRRTCVFVVTTFLAGVVTGLWAEAQPRLWPQWASQELPTVGEQPARAGDEAAAKPPQASQEFNTDDAAAPYAVVAPPRRVTFDDFAKAMFIRGH
jgi:hypothetical protein